MRKNKLLPTTCSTMAYRNWDIQLFPSSPSETETAVDLEEDRSMGITVTAGTYRLVATNSK